MIKADIIYRDALRPVLQSCHRGFGDKGVSQRTHSVHPHQCPKIRVKSHCYDKVESLPPFLYSRINPHTFLQNIHAFFLYIYNTYTHVNKVRG